MPTEALTLGPLHVLTQNVAYALPARRCFLQVSPDTATMEASVDGTDWDTLTIVEGRAEVAGGFIRATSGNVNAIVKS